MITARDYVAQAERELKELVETTEDKNIKHHANRHIDSIRGAIHYSAPDGMAFDGDEDALDGTWDLKDLLGKPLRLPYPKITVEWFCPSLFDDTDDSFKELVAAEETNAGIVITMLADNGNGDGWTEYVGVGHDEPYVVPMFDMVTEHYRRFLSDWSPAYAFDLLHFIGALSSGRDMASSHASPRQHLRRGHIRRHPTAGNLWVNSCVVGDPSNGVINKSYAVK